MKAPRKAKIIFITGTDTGVGKTVLTVLLLRHLRQNGVRAIGLKPFCCGSRDDAIWLQKECDDELSLSEVNPYYFRQPIAPGAATLKAKKKLRLKEVARQVERVADRYECALVEGVGGLLVPVAGRFLLVDLIETLRCQVIVVGRNCLGTINHTLLTTSELDRRGLRGSAVILMKNFAADISQRTNLTILSQYISKERLIEIPRVSDYPLLTAFSAFDERFLEKAVAKISALSNVCTRRWRLQRK